MDIREILNALNEDDRKLWSEHRTTMRRAYINAHNNTIGVEKWEATDDAFMDLIDIKLAILFDRSGKLFATKEIIGIEDATKIENDINKVKLTSVYEAAKVIDDKANWPSVK